jgi:transposase-like protein
VNLPKERNNGYRRVWQAYLCKQCGYQSLKFYRSQGYSDEVKQLCLKIYVNGMGFRAIERVTGINYNTIINNWVRQAAHNLPDAPETPAIPEIAKIDELQMFERCRYCRYQLGSWNLQNLGRLL